MRFAGNLHPEWGYLAPAPSFLRTARVALVAAAVGATAGVGVVLSLTDRPVETSVAARTLVQPVQAAASTVVGASRPALAQTPIAAESGSVSTAQAPANMAALAEAPAASDDAPPSPAAELKAASGAAPGADAAATRKKKPRHNFAGDPWRDGPIAVLPGEYHPSGFSHWANRDAGWGGYGSESYRYR
jgi:hypothetical protein